jgi:hypothetical protein
MAQPAATVDHRLRFRSLFIVAGMILAVVISLNHADTVVWTIIHGALGWLYVAYFVVTHYQLI